MCYVFGTLSDSNLEHRRTTLEQQQTNRYKRERYETWLNARVDEWLLERSGALDDVGTRIHGRSRSVIEYQRNHSLAVAEVRWKLRELNFSHLQQRVVGRTLWVMVLQFVGGIMQNAGAVLILHQECDCDCKNFQWKN